MLGCQVWTRLNLTKIQNNRCVYVHMCVYIACVKLYSLKDHKRGTTRSRQTMVLSLAVSRGPDHKLRIVN